MTDLDEAERLRRIASGHIREENDVAALGMLCESLALTHEHLRSLPPPPPAPPPSPSADLLGWKKCESCGGSGVAHELDSDADHGICPSCNGLGRFLPIQNAGEGASDEEIRVPSDAVAAEAFIDRYRDDAHEVLLPDIKRALRAGYYAGIERGRHHQASAQLDECDRWRSVVNAINARMPPDYQVLVGEQLDGTLANVSRMAGHFGALKHQASSDAATIAALRRVTDEACTLAEKAQPVTRSGRQQPCTDELAGVDLDPLCEAVDALPAHLRPSRETDGGG